MKINIYTDTINLPLGTKSLLLYLVKKGAYCEKLDQGDYYIVTYNHKQFHFIGEFCDLVPYGMGVLFSDHANIKKILADSQIEYAVQSRRKKRLLLFATSDGYWNVLQPIKRIIVGDGVSTIGQLLIQQELKHINSAFSHFNFTGDFLARIGNTVLAKGKKRVISNQEFRENGKFTDITANSSEKILLLVKKIMKSLSGMCYIQVEFSISKNQNISIQNIGVKLAPGIFFPMHRKKSTKDGIDVIANLLIQGHEKSRV